MKSSAPAPFPWRLAVLGGVSLGLYLLGSAWQPPLERTNYPFYLLWFSAVFAVYVLALLDIRPRGRQPGPVDIVVIVGWALIFRVGVLWMTPGFLSKDNWWSRQWQKVSHRPHSSMPWLSNSQPSRDLSIIPQNLQQIHPSTTP